ncbi:MAG: 50S ribosomal protein L11 methyltransferase [Candidatus Thermoplasmatota archaeon]|nr:50S ribosomal protein L11 methyltransferase [Candidatus Thermoplasmatota archaeon]
MIVEMVDRIFDVEAIKQLDVAVPETVYPPREDSFLLCEAIAELNFGKNTNALEIGCGSGIVTIMMSGLGWKVTAYDVNPFAISATLGNLKNLNLHKNACVIEGGLGEGLEITKEVDLLVWNIPYLDVEKGSSVLSPIEDAAMIDIPQGGWGKFLATFLSDRSSVISRDLLVVLLLKIDPEGQSKIGDWSSMGWSHRFLKEIRLGDEKIAVVAFWPTASMRKPQIIEKCESTMDEITGKDGAGWHRIFARTQTSGRGRRSSEWKSTGGGVYATWILDKNVLEKYPPGLIQTCVGSLVSEILGAYTKWPNDIITSDGRKMGGILVESINGEEIRLGVGANRIGFMEDGIETSGWEETIGQTESIDVFEMIDRSLSSVFEDIESLDLPSEDYLISKSWESLSRIMSTGVSLFFKGEPVRAVGLNRMGELEACGPDGELLIRDLEFLNWEYLSN